LRFGGLIANDGTARSLHQAQGDQGKDDVFGGEREALGLPSPALCLLFRRKCARFHAA
jgi:hypothetical protein